MILHEIEPRGYRNLAAQRVVLDPGLNLIAGENAQGKTNFLEAAHLLCCQRSFRAARTAELIAFGGESAEVRGAATVAELRRELTVAITPSGRRVLVDGKPTRPEAEALRGLAAVLFRPEDLRVARGAPAERRALIDGAIAVVWPQYRKLFRQYAKILQTRNRVLRTRPRDLSALLDVYDAQLAEAGARLIVARARFVRGLAPRFAEVFRSIADADAPRATLSYAPAPPIAEAAHTLADAGTALLALLRDARARDLARGVTEHGPHGDDVAFALDGRAARSYGSQGQLRALVLAFRMAQTEDALAKLGHPPVVLLDDVSSELDQRRTKNLLDFVSGITCQVLITTARPEVLPITEKVKLFHVLDGVISG